MTRPKILFRFVRTYDSYHPMIDIYGLVECGQEFSIGKIVNADSENPGLRLYNTIGVLGIQQLLGEMQAQEILKKVDWNDTKNRTSR